MPYSNYFLKHFFFTGLCTQVIVTLKCAKFHTLAVVQTNDYASKFGHMHTVILVLQSQGFNKLFVHVLFSNYFVQ